MAVCFGYFDASGNPYEQNRRHLTVAGYVGTESRWKRFEPKWEKVLSKYGITDFHANKMAQWAKPYNTWVTSDGKRDEAKRIAYLQELIKVIKGHVYKAFSVSISLDDWDAVNREYRLDELCRPYSICAVQVMRHAAVWTRKNHPKDDVLFLFEKGDADQGDVTRLMQRRRLYCEHGPLFVRKRWREPDGTTAYLRPFEACDLWAYEDALAVKLIGTGKAVRGAAQHLADQIPHSKYGYNAQGLRAICADLRVDRRQ